MIKDCCRLKADTEEGNAGGAGVKWGELCNNLA